MTFPSTLSPADRIAMLVRTMIDSVIGQSSVLPYVFMTSICMRLSGVGQRFRALALRVAAGTVRPPRPRGERALSADRVRRTRILPVVEVVDLPRGFAWLLRLVPGAANFGSQLVHLLEDPEMQALVASAPGFGRMLRPLCWMLAVSPLPDILKSPPRIRRAKSVPPAEPEPRTEPMPQAAPAPEGFPPMRPIYPKTGVFGGVEGWSRRSRGGFSSA